MELQERPEQEQPAETIQEAPQYTIEDVVLDNGGITDDQVRDWEAQHPLGVWHVRVPFADKPSVLARFPNAPQSDGPTLYRYVADCWLRAPSIEDAYALLDRSGSRRASDEYALNLLWLGGSPLIEQADTRKCDEVLRMAALLRIVPQVTQVPFATLKKSSLLSSKTPTPTAPPAGTS